MNTGVETDLDSLPTIVKATPLQSLREIDPTNVIRIFKQSGALLFRGFEVNSALFCEFTAQYGQDFGRIGGTLRTSANDAGSLFSVTEGTGDLEFHTELGHSPCRPDIIWFWCLKPAHSGGETLLLDGVEFARAMDSAELESLKERPLEYSHRMPQIMWKSFFGFETRPQCEEYLLKAEGVREVCFHRENVLTFKYVVPAIRQTRFGDARAFVNSILILTQTHDEVESDHPVKFSVDSDDENSFSMSVAFEGGSKITNSDLSKLRSLAHQLSVRYQLQKNEILMIDNTRFQHGRKSFRGNRQILSRYAHATFN